LGLDALAKSGPKHSIGGVRPAKHNVMKRPARSERIVAAAERDASPGSEQQASSIAHHWGHSL